MKITRIRFDTIRGGAVIAVGAPPSGDDESQLWRVPGDVIRAAAGFPLASVSAGSRIRIIVDLQSDSSPSSRLWIGAAAYSPHILGPLEDLSIEPTEWRDGRCKVAFEADSGVLGAGGVDEHHVTWLWHWRNDMDQEVRELGLSEHLLFITIESPTEPWSDRHVSSGRLTVPWLGAVKQACLWARGATSSPDAASRIVRSLFPLGEPAREPRLRYSADTESYLCAGMGNPRWFYCEGFLNDFADEHTTISINCYEGAAIVVTFANLLGCRLVPCVIEADCLEFTLNQTHPLGMPSTEAPDEFVVHVIALARMGKSVQANDLVYDAVIRIDPDSRPSSERTCFIMADGIALGTPTTPPGSGTYLPQLVARRSIRKCRARAIDSPWVGSRPEQERVDRCPLSRYVQYLWTLQRVERATGLPLRAQTLHITRYDGREVDSPCDSVPRRNLPPRPRSRRWLFTSQDSGSGHAVRVDWWTDDDPWITLSFMAELLAMSEIPMKPVVIPGVSAYTARRNTDLPRTGLLVLLAGAVIRFSSAGVRRIDMVDLYQTDVVVQ